MKNFLKIISEWNCEGVSKRISGRISKREFKNNKGISMVSLVITIILIIVLAAIAIRSGFEKDLQEAQFSKVLNEFIEVENAVIQRGMEYKLNSSVYPYENSVAYSEGNTITVNNVTYAAGYFLLKPTDFEKLGVSSVIREYIVNYETGEVILKEPYYFDDRAVYTKDDLLKQEQQVVEAEYDEKKGVNKPVLLSGMLPVKYNGSTWVVTSKNDEEWYDYSLDQGGGPARYANVMLMDGTTLRDAGGRELSNEQLRGTDLENLEGMIVADEGSMFIWIPRYTYKVESDGSRRIIYSNLTKDYTSNGYMKVPAFYYGEYAGAESTTEENSGYIAGGKELTGIWISKYEAGYEE